MRDMRGYTNFNGVSPTVIDIGGIDRRLLYRSLDASRDILKIQDGGRKRAKSSSDLSNIGK